MQLSPYLFFNGQCEAAFKFYEQCLGGKIVAMMTHGETPMADQTPPERLNTIVHARLTVGDAVLMGGDAPAERYEKPQGFAVAFNTATPAEAERIFYALAANGTIVMPIEETFWAVRFGMCVDQFGILWMVSCETAI
jgi:PhnB protein